MILALFHFGVGQSSEILAEKVTLVEDLFRYYDQQDDRIQLVGVNTKNHSDCYLQIDRSNDGFPRYHLNQSTIDPSGLEISLRSSAMYSDDLEENQSNYAKFYDSDLIPAFWGNRDIAELSKDGDILTTIFQHKPTWGLGKNEKTTCEFNLVENVSLQPIPEGCKETAYKKIIAECTFVENIGTPFFPIVSGKLDLVEHTRTRCSPGKETVELYGHSVDNSQYSYKKDGKIKKETGYLNVDLEIFSNRIYSNSVISTHTQTTGGNSGINKFEYDRRTKELDVFFYYLSSDFSVVMRKAFEAKFKCEETHPNN